MKSGMQSSALGFNLYITANGKVDHARSRLLQLALHVASMTGKRNGLMLLLVLMLLDADHRRPGAIWEMLMDLGRILLVLWILQQLFSVAEPVQRLPWKRGHARRT